MPADSQPPAVRVSDGDRDRAVARLTQAFEHGRLDTEEFSERSRLAYGAKFAADLEKLTMDLPTTTVPLTAKRVEVSQGRKRRWLCKVFGAQNRTGAWSAGTPLGVLSVLGSQVVDLTDVDARRISISALSLLGGCDVIVPKGARVDLGGLSLLGRTTDLSIPSGQSAMHVQIRTFGIFGGCTVRNLTQSELAERGYLPPPPN